MRINKGILKSQIITDNLELLQSLRNLYSFKVEGSQYSMKYRRGWDGKKNFITSNGVFPTGLLSRILEDLERIGCTPEVLLKDHTYSKVPPLCNVDEFIYRPYQTELIKYSLNHSRGLIKSPTGSGKTLILAGIIKSLMEFYPDIKITVLFRSKTILVQTYKFLESCGIKGLGINYGEGFIEDNIMLSTAQSIEKILDHVLNSNALLVDEVHEFSKGPQSVSIINSFPNAEYRFGFTATLPKEDIRLHNLIGAFGNPIQVVDTKELIDNGTLAKPIINILEMPELTEEMETLYDGMSYPEVYDDYIVDSSQRNQKIVDIINIIKKNNEQARVLVIVKSLRHGSQLQELLGKESEYIEGLNSIEERYSAIGDFKAARGNSILIGTTILQTGVDISEITHYINARGLKSEIATIQALGRALRTSEGKTKAFVYDFLDKAPYLKKHSKQRIKHYKTEEHEIKFIKI